MVTLPSNRTSRADSPGLHARVDLTANVEQAVSATRRRPSACLTTKPGVSLARSTLGLRPEVTTADLGDAASGDYQHLLVDGLPCAALSVAANRAVAPGQTGTMSTGGSASCPARRELL